MNAQRRRRSSKPAAPSTSSPPASGEREKSLPRILIADADPSVRAWLRPVLSRVRSDILEVSSGTELELQLMSTAGAALVITNAQLPSGTGLQALARARATGNSTPFIVFTSLQKHLLRVFVSDAAGTVLSSRVVDADNLVALAEGLLTQAANENP